MEGICPIKMVSDGQNNANIVGEFYFRPQFFRPFEDGKLWTYAALCHSNEIVRAKSD